MTIDCGNVGVVVLLLGWRLKFMLRLIVLHRVGRQHTVGKTRPTETALEFLPCTATLLRTVPSTVVVVVVAAIIQLNSMYYTV